METYYFYLGLNRYNLKGRSFVRVITCKDPNVDGLQTFTQHISLDGRYLPIVEDITFRKL
jgi:hypothetical protein